MSACARHAAREQKEQYILLRRMRETGRVAIRLLCKSPGFAFQGGVAGRGGLRGRPAYRVRTPLELEVAKWSLAPQVDNSEQHRIQRGAVFVLFAARHFREALELLYERKKGRGKRPDRGATTPCHLYRISTCSLHRILLLQTTFHTNRSCLHVKKSRASAKAEPDFGAAPCYYSVSLSIAIK